MPKRQDDLTELCILLQKYKGLVTPEKEVQDEIERMLRASDDFCPVFSREKWLSGGDFGRIDFYIETSLRLGIGIEVKVGGSSNDVNTQLWRYAQSPEIESLILVTTRQKLSPTYTELLTKPVRCVALWGSMI